MIASTNSPFQSSAERLRKNQLNSTARIAPTSTQKPIAGTPKLPMRNKYVPIIGTLLSELPVYHILKFL